MITVQNIKNALLIMDFTENDGLFEKEYPAFRCKMQVDFSAKKLIYPESIKGRERNDGFNQLENFVVFECVNRLLEKGYCPEHIELEKAWHLGHDPKGGRADICVSDIDGSMLLIIECKKADKFDAEYKKLRKDGGQLFSYWQQEGATKWLVLYTSDYVDGKIEYKAPAISCADDANAIEHSKKDKDIRLYSTAHTAVELFEVWRDTYSQYEYNDPVFSDYASAYNVGDILLFKNRLIDFNPGDKIVNKFEEILRHNNVSDKENAFNRLVALFICKLVDESTKGDNDIVEFQYKRGETYENLQDRLQRLHQEGMEKFMREKIFYIPADYPERLFLTYTGSKRRKAIEDLQNTIRILKFYSNNDFAFKDVHNEELFYQNGRVLVEMVQLFEKYRIVYPSKHQFLGLLFEQLLNKGFKQNEGQFFTPIPITRFIWDSLPVDRMVKSDKGTVYPKVIDYACGAGHFLTEAIEAINSFADNNGDNTWVRDSIFGIEKDYRLSRVSKISLFMNGAGEGNIIFGDGLENAPDKGIENESFDILVANPPYSVKDFKQHLLLKNNSFELLDRIGDSSGEIEVLFVERISQLLKPKGIAAVILPVTILSKNTSSYIGAREQILKNFLIRGIVHLGNGAFGKTGSDTIIIYLEKYAEPPKMIDLVTDSVNAILNGDNLEEWEDSQIFERYLRQIDVSKEEYTSYILEETELDELASSEYFDVYVTEFLTSSNYNKVTKTKKFQKKDEIEKATEIKALFYKYSKAIEFDKLFYFALTKDQQTVIVSSPQKTKERKLFLGYEYKDTKGFEGIHEIKPGGCLYNNKDRNDTSTLAYAIRKSFDDVVPVMSEDNQKYAGIVNTCDMLNYVRPIFDKAIRLSAAKKIEIQSQYPMSKLGKIAPFSTNRINVDQIQLSDYVTTDNMLKNKAGITKFSGETDIDSVVEYQPGDILVSNIRPYLKKIWFADRNGGCSPDVLVFRTVDKEKVKPEYLFCILAQDIFFDYMMANRQGIKMPRGDKTMIPLFRIPIPPMDIQLLIIAESKRINTEYSQVMKKIQEYCTEIEKVFVDLGELPKTQVKYYLADKDKFTVMIGQRVIESELEYDGTIPVYSANVFEPFGYFDKLLLEDFSTDSVLWGIDGDWMVNYQPKEMPFYPTDHCGVLRVVTNEVNPRYMARILEEEGRKMGFSRSYRASIDRVESISFAVPDIDVQNKAMEEVLRLEKLIKDAEKLLKTLSEKRSEIVQRYL